VFVSGQPLALPISAFRSVSESGRLAGMVCPFGTETDTLPDTIECYFTELLFVSWCLVYPRSSRKLSGGIAYLGPGIRPTEM
jgi:hypothetical protein